MADPKESLSVLIAADEPLVRKILSLYLRGFGHVVHVVTNGTEADVAFNDKREAIDLLILDVQMPGPDSRNLFTAIREIDPTVPILFCSRTFRHGPKVRPIDAAWTAVLPKPFSRSELKSAIDYLFAAPD